MRQISVTFRKNSLKSCIAKGKGLKINNTLHMLEKKLQVKPKENKKKKCFLKKAEFNNI